MVNSRPEGQGVLSRFNLVIQFQGLYLNPLCKLFGGQPHFPALCVFPVQCRPHATNSLCMSIHYFHRNTKVFAFCFNHSGIIASKTRVMNSKVSVLHIKDSLLFSSPPMPHPIRLSALVFGPGEAVLDFLSLRGASDI